MSSGVKNQIYRINLLTIEFIDFEKERTIKEIESARKDSHQEDYLQQTSTPIKELPSPVNHNFNIPHSPPTKRWSFPNERKKKWWHRFVPNFLRISEGTLSSSIRPYQEGE